MTLYKEVIKWHKMSLVECGACSECRVLVGTPVGRNKWEDLDVDGRD
jgi:hypothetical protein